MIQTNDAAVKEMMAPKLLLINKIQTGGSQWLKILMKIISHLIINTDPKANKAAGWKASVTGRINMTALINQTPTAIRRTGPTSSNNKEIAREIVTIGFKTLMVVVSAKGIRGARRTVS